MKPNPDWKKWAGWLGPGRTKGTIYHDVVFNMRAARQLWEGFQAIVDVAPDRAKQYGTFHSWFNQSYAGSQGLTIRRQVEVSDDVVSLGRLLDRIQKAPNVLTRERYLFEHHLEQEARKRVLRRAHLTWGTNHRSGNAAPRLGTSP